MTTATLRFSTALPEARTVTKKSLFARVVDAMIEARLRRAMREIALHRHLIPDNMLKDLGYTATVTRDGSLPFTR